MHGRYGESQDRMKCNMSSCSLVVKIDENGKIGVSKNNGTPKSSILIGFSIINHPFLGTHPYFWKHPNGIAQWIAVG